MLRPVWSLNRPRRPVTSEASADLLPPPLLRLLPAGAIRAGWDSHPRKKCTLARRTVKPMCRMLLVGYFPPVFYVSTEVVGRRNAVCGAVCAAATCLTWSSFASAGSSDLENRWDRSLEIRSPRIKHDTGRARLPGTRRNRRTSASSLFPLFSHQEHMPWLSSSA